MMKENMEPFHALGSTEISEDHLYIDEDWKNYDESMEKLCFFVAKLDKEANGEIEATGDDSYDFWKLVIENGEVMRLEGHKEYDGPIKQEFDDTNLKNILNDKDLDKKMLLSSL